MMRLGFIGFVVAALAVSLLSAGQAGAGSPSVPQLVVNSTASAGDGTCDETCTLRDAIGDANDTSGVQDIVFDQTVFPPSAPGVIMLETGLPMIDGGGDIMIHGGGGVIIDGSKLSGDENGLSIVSPGRSPDLVEVYGVTLRNFPGAGLAFCAGEMPSCSQNASNLVFNGISALNNVSHGIIIRGAAISNLQVRGCTIDSNAAYGLYVSASGTLTNVAISSCDSSRNKSYGILGESEGSIVDLLIQQVSVTENGYVGAYFDAVEETINPTVDTVNASNNQTMGLGFSSAQPLTGLTFVNSTIDGNGSAFTNGLGTEVLAYQVLDATITGNSFSDNEASGNLGGVGFQIYSQFEMPSGIVFQDNRVQDNTGPGVSIITDTPGEKDVDASIVSMNVISGNTTNGIQIEDSRRITISDNSTYGNGSLGIDLVGGEVKNKGIGDGDVTPNDPGDDDEGANDLLNFPEFSGQTAGSVSGTACGGCKVEVFRSDDDPSGHGEGERLIGSGIAAGGGAFTIAICGVGPGDSVTATATDQAGNTSEFSANLDITQAAEPCAGDVLQGDVDCDGDIDSVDALKVLRHVASLSVVQTEPCDDIGTGLARVVSSGEVTGIGDVDCDLDVDSVDALKILRHVASLPVQQTEPCRDIGT